jgi:hypothetical protein
MSFSVLQKVLTSANSEKLSATSYPCARAIIQAKRANAGAVEIAPGTVTTGKAYELPKPTAGAKLPELELVPQFGTSGVDLKDWEMLGTQNDGVNIIAEIY